jgi:hypothetical protein
VTSVLSPAKSATNTGGDLPHGWAASTLGEICQVNPSKPRRDEIAADAEVTFVPMPGVDANSGTIATPQIRGFDEVRKGFTAFRENDVIMAKITPCMENGKAAIAKGLRNGLGFGSTEFHVFRSRGAVLPEYVYYFIRQESFRSLAETEMTGSVGQKRVPADFVESAEILLHSPNRNESWRPSSGLRPECMQPANDWSKSPPSSNASANLSSPPPAPAASPKTGALRTTLTLTKRQRRF